VADRGCGIDAEELHRVFEPFFSKKPTGESSGTGLGLAIVQSVVKEHQGYIDVTSTPQVGTTFTLYFPLVTPPQPPPTPRPPPARGNAKVLVVDDDPIQQRTFRRVLTGLGYTVETRSNGAEAIALFPAGVERPFDLVLVDMLLGGSLDGLEVVERIRERFPDQKVIIASGHAPPPRVEAALAQGLPWLAKPYTLEDLAGMIARLLRS
jgi:two-component system cell cycle sensor histidine kinase/response regulator CckA